MQIDPVTELLKIRRSSDIGQCYATVTLQVIKN